MQTWSNNGLIEDPALNQASKNDNKSAKGSFYETILEALQELVKGNALPIGKDVQLLDDQKTSKILDTISAGDPMEVNTPPGNEKFGEKDKIAAEIE